MRAGVLIAGSLIWDEHPQRVEWRRRRLQVEHRQQVCAPIRYGRRSANRSDTYTTVYSGSCIRDGVGTGTGLVVPFANEVEHLSELAHEATELWRVERKASSERRNVVSAGWGSVGLLINPDSEHIRKLEEFWTGIASRSPNYGRLAVGSGEKAAVDGRTGRARFAWSGLAPGGASIDLDLLFFAATTPTLEGGRYPSPKTIADAWRAAPGEAAYFRRNREWGITTHEDAEIESHLEDATGST